MFSGVFKKLCPGLKKKPTYQQEYRVSAGKVLLERHCVVEDYWGSLSCHHTLSRKHKNAFHRGTSQQSTGSQYFLYYYHFERNINLKTTVENCCYLCVCFMVFCFTMFVPFMSQFHLCLVFSVCCGSLVSVFIYLPEVSLFSFFRFTFSPFPSCFILIVPCTLYSVLLTMSHYFSLHVVFVLFSPQAVWSIGPCWTPVCELLVFVLTWAILNSTFWALKQ